MKKVHIRAKARAHFLDQLTLLFPTARIEFGPACFIFRDPLSREFSILDFLEHPAHGAPRFFCDDLRAASVVAVLRCVANGIAHVTQTTAIHQVDDEFQFMETFEISDFRLIAGFYERLESGFPPSADASGKN